MQQGPYSTNLLIAGWDEKIGPSLYWMDYLATMHSMNIAGTGYGASSSQPIFCSAYQHTKPALSISRCLQHIAIHCLTCASVWLLLSHLLVGGAAHLIDAKTRISSPAHIHAGSYFVLSMVDRLWHPDLTQEEAVKLMEKGIEEVSFAYAASAHDDLTGISCWALLHVQMSICPTAH